MNMLSDKEKTLGLLVSAIVNAAVELSVCCCFIFQYMLGTLVCALVSP